MKRISISNHKRVNDLAMISANGLQWADHAGENPEYELGGVEAVAHQLSCCLCQWFGIELDTAETRDYFNLERFPSATIIEADLVKLIQKS